MSKHKKHEHDPQKLGDVGEMPPSTPGEDVNVHAIVRFGIGLTVAATLVSALVFVLMQTLLRYESKHDPARPPMGAPERELGDPDVRGAKAVLPDGGVRLQREPFQDLEQEKEEEGKILNSPPHWLDEKAGVVRIPIARAMKLVVSRGLPVRAPGQRLVPVTAPSPSAPAARPAATRTRAVEKKKAFPEPSAAPVAETPETPAATEGEQ